MDTNRKRRGSTFWREYRGTILFLVLLMGFRSAWADWVTVPTASMNPTILEGDRVFIDKHVFGWRVPFTLWHLSAGENPARGDIVVFDSPEDGKSLVKRVVAVPGDQVSLQGEALVINGRQAHYAAGDPDHLRELLAATLAEHPQVVRESGFGAAHDILLLDDRAAPRSFGPVTVPAGSYFVLGDNRDNSRDSRYIGFIPRKNIVGRATHVVASLDPQAHYLPRRDRFLVSLR